MKIIGAILLCLLATTASAAEKPKAPAGFKWKTYKDAFCELQVPDGWFEKRHMEGITQVIRLSPTKIKDGKGIDTGFTINVVKCSSQQEWATAMDLVGKMMSDVRKATEHPIESRVQDSDDMLFMVIEGERLISDAPHPEKMYHVWVIVRAFPKFATIYMYSFGALVEDWEREWKKGGVIFSPVHFSLQK